VHWLNLFSKFSVTERTAGVVNIWNSLPVPNVVVLASSLDTFKNRLDRFWDNQDVKYDYTAELTGAGSRS